MRFSSTLFTALVAAALVVPSFGAPIEKRAKVCPAVDDAGTALVKQEVTDDGLLACSYAAAGGCEYFLGNGNFSSGASSCPDAGLDPGAPGASTGGGASAPAPAPPAGSTTAAPPATTPAPTVPAPAPAPETPTTATTPAPRTTVTPGGTGTGTGTGTAATPKPTNAALGRYAPHGTALIAGLAIVLSVVAL